MGARQQETGIALRCVPLGATARQRALHPPSGAAVAQPLAQARPFAQQRLVRHFDRWPARLQVAIEGEEAGFAEGLNDGGNWGLVIGGWRLEVGSWIGQRFNL